MAALGSAAVGAISSAIQNKKARNLLASQQQDIANQKAENRSWYNTRMSEDYTNRVDSQAVINKQRELLQEQADNVRAAAVVGGASPEASAIAKAQANSSLAQTMSDIAAQGAAYKDKVEQEYRQQESNLNAQQAQLKQQEGQIAHNRAATIAQSAGQAVTSAINVGANNIAMGTGNPSAKAYTKANAVNSAIANEGAKKMAQTATNAQKTLDSNIRNSIFKGIK